MNLDRENPIKTFVQNRVILTIAGLSLFATVSAISGLLCYEFRATTNATGRSLSSAPATFPFPLHKTGGLIHSEIIAESDAPVSANVPFRLKAKVTLRTDIQELRYAWTLPEGVRLRAGSFDGTLTNVSAGDTPEFSVELETDSNDLRRIQFRAWKTNASARPGDERANTIGHTAIYLVGSERSQSTIEAQGSAQRKLERHGGAVRSPEEFRRRAIQ